MAEDSLLYGERNGEGDPCTCFLLDDSLMSGSPAWTNLCFFCEEGLTLMRSTVTCWAAPDGAIVLGGSPPHRRTSPTQTEPSPPTTRHLARPIPMVSTVSLTFMGRY